MAANLLGDDVKITAFRSVAWSESPLSRIYSKVDPFLACKVEEFEKFIGMDMSIDKFDLIDEYAKTHETVYETIKYLARMEGILLDPIYTGKAFTGLLDYIKRGKVVPGEKVLFIHSGGVVNNFKFSREVTQLFA